MNARIALSALLLPLLASTTTWAQPVAPIDTRFGPLTSNADGYLAFNGTEVEPAVLYLASAAYTPLRQFRVGDADVVLFQQAHGNACPGNFVFVTVTAAGATASAGVGTCHDQAIEPYQSGNSLLFSMPNLGGEGSTTFLYHDGVVFQSLESEE